MSLYVALLLSCTLGCDLGCQMGISILDNQRLFLTYSGKEAT